MKKILSILLIMFTSCFVWAQSAMVPSPDRYRSELIPYLHHTCKISAYRHFNIGKLTNYHINDDVEQSLISKGYYPVTEGPSSDVLSFDVSILPYDLEKAPILITISDNGDPHYIYRNLKFKDFGNINSSDIDDRDKVNKKINEFVADYFNTFLRPCVVKP